MNKASRVDFWNNSAKDRIYWKRRNRYYHKHLEKFYGFVIPEGSRVLELGCGTGDLLASVKPSRGVGVDFSEEMISIARRFYPHLEFIVDDCEDLKLNEKFDYVIMSDLVGGLYDIQKTFDELKKVTTPRTRIVLNFYNYLWEPIMLFGEFIGLKKKQPLQNWLSEKDVENLLELVGYEVIRRDSGMLIPVYIPIVSEVCNKLLNKLPILNQLNLTQFVIARERTLLPPQDHKNFTVSVIIPARNEAGTIEDTVKRMPDMGRRTEIIFVEGNSNDDTYSKIEEVMKHYPEKSIRLFRQLGKGKGDAVRMGFSKADGDMLMILDADLTVAPEDLPKFFNAFVSNRGEFINGVRLIYPMAGGAMRFLNLVGNKFFSIIFSWLIGQHIKDTLCGTKVLWRRDYERISKGRVFFGDFDPFGDFDLLFGAAKLNLKIVDVPVRYRSRVYGETNISRFTHGLLLFRMCYVGFRRLKRL